MTMEDMWQVENAPSIPARFANVNRTIKPPAPRFTDPRMGEGVPISGTGGEYGMYGGIDLNTPTYIDKVTGRRIVLPPTNKGTRLTDDEFDLAWAREIAKGKPAPTVWQKKSFMWGEGHNAPTENEARRLLESKGESLGVLGPDTTSGPRGTAGVGMEAQGTGGPTLGRRLIDFLAGPDDARNQRISSGIQGSPDTYAAPIIDEEDPSAPTRGRQQQQTGADLEAPQIQVGPYMGGTPDIQTTEYRGPAVGPDDIQFVGGPGSGAPISGSPQASVVVPGITTGTGRSAEARDVERGRPGRPGEGVPISGSTAATTVVPGVMTGTGRSALEQDVERGRPPMVNTVDQFVGGPGEGGIIAGSGGSTAAQANLQSGAWTPEQWIAAGYTQMPDGSWDIVPEQVPQVTTTTTPPAVVNPAGSQPGGTAVNATWEDVANQRAAEAAASQAATTTTPAVSDMFANVAQTGAPLWQAAQDPFQQYQRYRMAQAGGAPIGTLTSAAGQQALRSGYQPAYGRFLLGGTQLGVDDGWQQGGEGEAFGRYLAGGQRRDLGDIRSLYGGLGSYLGSLGTATDPSQLNLQYASVFGTEPRREDVLSATQAALGMGSGMGARSYRNLGNIYDLMQTQYGPQGAGRFADWVGTAFQPQQQQPLFQQPANGRQPQLLGTETLQQQSPNWDMQLEDF